MNIRMRKFTAVLSLVATGSLLSIAQAQTAPAVSATTAASTTPQVMEKFEVTGSYLSPAANAIAIPVITVDADMIENSGDTTNVLEILRKTVPQFSGNGNLGVTNANVGSGSTQGGSQLLLRNTSTLVLINGRRSAYSPASATGGFQFVDVNMIPVSAIERIEVLADGASAIYGSDAVGGVVNVILKTNFEGFEMGGRYGWSTNKGKNAERSAYVVGGVSNGKTSFTLSAEWLKQDPIFAYERPYSDPTFGTPTFAGSVNIPSITGANFFFLDPDLNAPTVTGGGQSPAALVAAGVYEGPLAQGAMFEKFNLSQYVTQSIQNTRESVTAAFSHQISDNLTGFGDILFVHTDTYSQINGQPINSSALAALPVGSFEGAGGTTIPAGLYGNPFNVPVTARNRLVTAPRGYVYDTTGIRGVGGFTGKLSDTWSWEAAATWNRISQNYQNPGVINNAALANAIVTNQFNFFARQQAPGVLDTLGIVGTATGGFISEMVNFDLKVRGTLFELPAGPVDIAVGGEQRREELSATADPNSQLDPVTGELGWNGATTLYPFNTNRQVGSLFAEARIPLAKDAPGFHLLELTGAVRHEFISDTENPTVPKVTLRYLPVNDEFALRGTYSKSFSAPTLYGLFGPISIGFTDPFTLDPAGGGDPIDNMQTNAQSGSNPNLRPSESENYTVGFVYSPKSVRGLSISVDYWNIDQTDLISSIPDATVLQDVETKGTASAYANAVRFFSFSGPGVTAPGQISNIAPDDIYLVNNNVNIASQKLDGWDIKARYTYSAGDNGRFDFGTAIGIYNSYTHVDVPGEPELETAGRATIFNGTIPRWQAYTTLDYTRGDYGAFIGWRSMPSVLDDEDGERLGKYNTFDARLSYVFGNQSTGWRRYFNGMKVSLGANNVFNKFGPVDTGPTVFTDANMDITTYGAMGRFLYVDLKFKF